MTRRPRDARGTDGFTLVEILVSVVVLLIMLSAVALSINGGLNLSRNNKNRTVAANLAAQEMDTVRAASVQSFASLVSGQTESIQVVDGVRYTVDRDVYWVAKDATASPCDGPGGSALAYLRVTVSVTWPEMNKTRPVVSTTVVTPPVGGYSPISGHLPVKVTGADGTPRGGVQVRLLQNGSEVTTQETTEDGCAFFGYLPATSAGTAYTVQLAESGWVDGQSNPNPSLATTVYPGAYTPQSIVYDQAGGLNLTLVTNPVGAVLPNSVPVLVGNQHFALGRKVFPGDGGARAITGLFPWADGFELWTGDCADSDPEGAKPGSGGPYYVGQSRADIANVAPAATTSTSITMANQPITVTGPTGARVANTAFTVILTHPVDALCATGATLTYPLVTDATGAARLAMPYGIWTFTISGKTAQTTWPAATVAPPAVATRVAIDIKIK